MAEYLGYFVPFQIIPIFLQQQSFRTQTSLLYSLDNIMIVEPLLSLSLPTNEVLTLLKADGVFI